ncbi:hypothetical protein, partial [Klebsiella pneumoniae]|uniref:hypothetical protein n=1 Tax=Klebsiella pneumoniae TaxID=573 RepID=UPI001D0DCC4C
EEPAAFGWFFTVKGCQACLEVLKRLSEGLWRFLGGFVRVRVSLSLGYEARNGKRGGSSVEVFGSKFLNKY